MKYLIISTTAVTIITIAVVFFAYLTATHDQSIQNVQHDSASPEIGLLSLSSSSDDTGYPMPASGHSQPDPIDGSCGSAAGTTSTSQPSSGLCSSGSTGSVSSSGGLRNSNARWNWSCNGQNGGSSTSCSAPRRIHGQCASVASATNVTDQPSGQLCNRGLETSVSGNKANGWSWQCGGINGGSTASCSPIGMCTNSHDYHPNYEPTVSASFVGNSWGNSIGAAAPDDRIEITYDGDWTSSESANHSTYTCQTTNFSNSGDVIRAGEDMGMGQSQTYSVSCTETLCNNTNTDSVTIGVAQANFSSYTISDEIIRAGDSVEISWNITADSRSPYPMNCTLRGAISEQFNVPTRANSSAVSPPLFNKFINQLRCVEPVTSGSGQSPSEILTSNEVEVIPAPIER